MNNELEKSIDKLKKIITEKSESGYEIALYDFGKDGSKTVLQALENSIPKKKIEEYLTEETEKYKVYKKEVDKNENLRGQLWHHMGAKNMCEKILGIEKTVTLD